jgi:hypothetical protein
LLIVAERMKKMDGITEIEIRWDVTIKIIRINENKSKEA